MYAVIKTGGKQYRVQPGDVMVVEKLDGEPGANVAFGEVLMLGDGDAVTLGEPTVAGASVNATLVETRKGEKVKIFKKIRRQGYRRTKGHRQTETVLRVTGIEGAGMSAKWDGVVDMTTKAMMNARARNLTHVIAELEENTGTLLLRRCGSSCHSLAPSHLKRGSSRTHTFLPLRAWQQKVAARSCLHSH